MECKCRCNVYFPDGVLNVKGTNESITRVDSSVPLINDNPAGAWITDPDPRHHKGMHPKCVYHH